MLPSLCRTCINSNHALLHAAPAGMQQHCHDFPSPSQKKLLLRNFPFHFLQNSITAAIIIIIPPIYCFFNKQSYKSMIYHGISSPFTKMAALSPFFFPRKKSHSIVVFFRQSLMFFSNKGASAGRHFIGFSFAIIFCDQRYTLFLFSCNKKCSFPYTKKYGFSFLFHLAFHQ